MEFLDWMEIGEPIQSTFQRGAAMTNISMIDDNQEGAVQMISINLNNVSAEDKTKFLKAFTEEASNNLKAVYGENSIKKNMVKEIENMIIKNNGIDSTDLSSIVNLRFSFATSKRPNPVILFIILLSFRVLS